MNNSVRFSCTALAGTGKQGILPRDSDGYYTMPVGGLNVFNSVGDYYPYEGAKAIFTGSGAFMRRIKSGCLKGENGHPKMQQGQSMDSFAQRVMTIDERNTCAHFADIWLDFDQVKDELGKPVVAIMAKLTPEGPFGPALQKSLDNPKEEVCFSIRAFTEDVRVNGVKHRNLVEVVSFDRVTEPGISIAKKYRAPSLESYGEHLFTREDVAKSLKPAHAGISMESNTAHGLDLMRALGWDLDPSYKPSYCKW